MRGVTLPITSLSLWSLALKQRQASYVRIDSGHVQVLRWSRPASSPRFCKETSMSKILKCSDINPECNVEIRGDSDHDVLRKAAEHAKTAHHMENIPPDVLSKVKGAIRDEGGTRTQKAGSSN